MKYIYKCGSVLVIKLFADTKCGEYSTGATQKCKGNGYVFAYSKL